jgi:hypothetical protein
LAESFDAVAPPSYYSSLSFNNDYSYRPLRASFEVIDGSNRAAAWARIHFEFWPSDLLKLFKIAGIPRRTPPPSGANCPLMQKTYHVLPLKLLPPKSNVTYQSRYADHGSERIPVQASADADVNEINWFAGNT